MDKMTIRKWETYFKCNDFTLISQINISDNEFEELKLYFKNAIIMCESSRACIPVAIFLVYIAIRYYSDDKYWDAVNKAIEQDLTQSQRIAASESFINTLRLYNLFILPDKGKNQYVENIKAHAFVANNYMSGFFDFSQAYYENILFCQLDKKDFMQDIPNFQNYMKNLLDCNNNDDINLPGKIKHYKLLKSTKQVFAYATPQLIEKILYPTLKRIDKYYYDGQILDNSDRFNIGFIKWCKEQENAIQTKRTREFISRNPYIYFNSNDLRFYVCIPNQKFRSNEYNGHIYLQLKSENVNYDTDSEEYSSKEYDLDVYSKFGIFVSDQKDIPIKSPFCNLDIEIRNDNDFVRSFPSMCESVYRILEYKDSGKLKSSNRLKSGENIIIFKKNVSIQYNEYVKLIDEQCFNDFKMINIECLDGAIIQIEDKMLRYTTNDYYDAVFNEQLSKLNCKYFEITDNLNRPIRYTRFHPIITFSSDKKYKNSIIILINSTNYSIKELDENYPSSLDISIDENMKNRIHIMVNLEKILYSKIGYYDIKVCIPGQNAKEVCSYLCLSQDIEVRRNKSFYTSSSKIVINTKTSEFSGIHLNPLFQTKKENEEYSVNSIFHNRYAALEAPYDITEVLFEFSLNQNDYLVHIPILKSEFGDSKENLVSLEDSIWYKDLKNNIILKIPGAEEIKIEFIYKKLKCEFIGNKIEGNIYLFDISSIIDNIRLENNTTFGTMKILFTDYLNRKRKLEIKVYRQLDLPSIYKNLKLENIFFPKEKIEYNLEDNVAFLTIDSIMFENKSKLYFKILEVQSNKVIFDGVVTTGKNVIKNLCLNKDYRIEPYFYERKLFSKEKIPMKWIKIEGKKDYLDLSKYHINIQKIRHLNSELPLTKSEYGIDFIKKIEINSYKGRLYSSPIENDRIDFTRKTTIGTVKFDVIEYGRKTLALLYILDLEDLSWVELYYDKKEEKILNPFSKSLNNKDYKRFDPLYDDNTEFVLFLKPRKEKNNDI